MCRISPNPGMPDFCSHVKTLKLGSLEQQVDLGLFHLCTSLSVQLSLEPGCYQADGLGLQCHTCLNTNHVLLFGNVLILDGTNCVE